MVTKLTPQAIFDHGGTRVNAVALHLRISEMPTDQVRGLKAHGSMPATMNTTGDPD